MFERVNELNPTKPGNLEILETERGNEASQSAITADLVKAAAPSPTLYRELNNDLAANAARVSQQDSIQFCQASSQAVCACSSSIRVPGKAAAAAATAGNGRDSCRRG